MADFSSIEGIVIGYKPVQVDDGTLGLGNRRFRLQEVTFGDLIGENSTRAIDEVRKILEDKYGLIKAGIEAFKKRERRDLHSDDLADISFQSSAYREALDLMDRTYGSPRS
ncbi:MAG: hypothetical protein AABW89_05980 [Nanoarchaeota archaeon]